MDNYEWSTVPSIMPFVVEKWVVDDNIKGLHNCPLVPLDYDLFSDAQGGMFNKLLNIIATMPEVTEMVTCPTFLSHMPDGSSLNSGHPRDRRVRYGLSHSNCLPMLNT